MINFILRNILGVKKNHEVSPEQKLQQLLSHTWKYSLLNQITEPKLCFINDTRHENVRLQVCKVPVISPLVVLEGERRARREEEW